MEKKKSNQEILDSYDYLAHAASTQDCTGLIQTPPQNEAEIESYESIYPYLPPEQEDSLRK